MLTYTEDCAQIEEVGTQPLAWNYSSNGSIINNAASEQQHWTTTTTSSRPQLALQKVSNDTDVLNCLQ